ncbi:MAG: MBL fold metallo-hydrolase [Chitinophagaceae bacterium]
MNLSITGYSTALFSTWYFIEELGLLFDAGEGLTSALLQKSRKVTHVFISHADRDHLTGLLQFNQLNARPGFPVIHFPKDSGSFTAIETFSKKFDPHVSGTVWQPLDDGAIITVKDSIEVQAVRNSHVPAQKETIKSLSYKVLQVKSKLKKEFTTLSPNEIRTLSLEKGKDFTTEKISTNILSYSGDTPVEGYATWDQSKILIHEATFLGGDEGTAVKTHGNKHSTLEEVMKMVSEIKIEVLILGHFSSRYAPEQIDNRIKELHKKYNLKIPVFRILPGATVFNILQTPPLCE